ncbi:MAG TPA: zinc-ribbon and DUF3426 domain-containing protein [Burkholderiaceae bacterium]|nr:zinc-ribbon and DUF3426 domain-containing protein [Burkholderiaceae bacterium]
MSLATRCTSCGTVFRVVQDQLKISEGWVRCGRCEQVFNALEGLFDLERDTPPGGAAAHFEDLPQPSRTDEHRERDDGGRRQGPTTAHGPMPSSHPLDSRDDDDASPDPGLVERIDAHLFGKRRTSESDSTPAAHVDKRDRHEFSDAQFDPNLVIDEDEEPVIPGLGTAMPASDPMPLESEAATAKAAAASEPAAPEFLRQAHERARWQQPRVRIALGAALGLFALVFVLQAAHHFRDAVAARWPSTQPLLLAWCDLAGCSIGTPRRIDDIVVDSTALGRLSADAFRLSVTLRNRGTLVVALPDVDLTLTDVGGQLLARRVLAPRDFRITQTMLPPGGEVALQAPIAAGTLPVSGYTVEVFYP